MRTRAHFPENENAHLLYICISSILAQIDVAVTLTKFDFFLHNTLWSFLKNTVHEVLDYEENLLGSISPKITQKIENDTVGRYRFRWNFDSEFYVTKQIFWAKGESGRGFGLEVMEKWKVKKKLKTRKWLNMMVPNFLYCNITISTIYYIIVIIIIFLLPTYFPKLPRQVFFNIRAKFDQHSFS